MMKSQMELKSEKKLKCEMKLLEAVGLLDNAMIEDAMIEDAMTEGATIEDTMTEGAMIEDAMTEGVTIEDAITEGATIEDAMTEGVTIEDAMTEGATTEDTMTEGVTIENAITEDAMTKDTEITDDTMTDNAMTDDADNDKDADTIKQERRIFKLGRHVAAVAAIAACFIIAIPVLAKEIPTVYRIIDRYAPAFADYIIPNELSDEKEGIRMQVEAVYVEGKNASLVVSFSDLPGYDRISGKVDLFDSYNLSSFETDTSIGGCSFLEYNEQEDKAYFLINIMGDGEYEKEKIQFTVDTLLTRVSALEKEIPLSEILDNPILKEVEISGSGVGSRGRELCSKLINGRTARVIDLSELMDMGNLDRDDLSVTGIAYADGILHVQSCRGSGEEAERHLRLELFVNGEEWEDGMGVCWHEEVDGEELIFDEDWYVVSPEELAQSRLVGIFHIADSPVHGNWKVITRIE